LVTKTLSNPWFITIYELEKSYDPKKEHIILWCKCVVEIFSRIAILIFNYSLFEQG
jgi:hypothetical protein